MRLTKMLRTFGIAAAAFSLLFAFSLAVPATVEAQANKKAVCEGVGLVGGDDDCEVPDGSPTVARLVATVINILSWIVGIVAVIMLIIGGLKYVLSSGDSANITSAKNTIIYALVGVAIAALAQVLVRFVFNQVT